MRFEVGKVYDEDAGTDYHVRYKVLSIADDHMLVSILYSKSSLWGKEEQDVFSTEMSEFAQLNKEYTVKELLRNVEKQEKADSKRSAKGNAGDSKPKTKKGCKKCDSSGCRCNASGR